MRFRLSSVAVVNADFENSQENKDATSSCLCFGNGRHGRLHAARGAHLFRYAFGHNDPCFSAFRYTYEEARSAEFARVCAHSDRLCRPVLDRLGITAPLRPCNARDNSLLGACAAEAQGLCRAPSAVEDKDGGCLYRRGADHCRCGNGVHFARLNEALRQFQLHFAACKSRDHPRCFAVHGAERDRRGVRLDNSYF